MLELLDTPALCEALRQRRRSGLEVPRIILGPNADPQTITALETLAVEGAVQLFRSPRPQSVHFMVIGQKTVVVGEQQQDASGSCQSAIFDHPGIAAMFNRRFRAIIRAGLAEPFISDHQSR